MDDQPRHIFLSPRLAARDCTEGKQAEGPKATRPILTLAAVDCICPADRTKVGARRGGDGVPDTDHYWTEEVEYVPQLEIVLVSQQICQRQARGSKAGSGLKAVYALTSAPTIKLPPAPPLLMSLPIPCKTSSAQ